jgi:hypothetical protein
MLLLILALALMAIETRIDHARRKVERRRLTHFDPPARSIVELRGSRPMTRTETDMCYLADRELAVPPDAATETHR